MLAEVGSKLLAQGIPLADWVALEEAHYGERGLFQVEAVRRLLEEHASGRENRHMQIWTLLMLELWHRRFID